MNLVTARGAPLVLLAGGAIALATALRQIGDQPIVYDALWYVWLSDLLAAGQIDVEAFRTKGWGLRTYGYPAFLIPWRALAGEDHGALQWLVFAAQVAIHLGACWLLARRVARAFGDDGLGRATLILLVLNPFVLILTGLLLADFLSAALIAVAVALLLPPRGPAPPAGAVLRDGMLALGTLALAAEVRPANAMLVPLGALLWGIRWWGSARCAPPRFVGGLVLAGAVSLLPLIPQAALNWRIFGTPHPFVVESLYGLQLQLGLENLKYATILPRDFRIKPTLPYVSPFSHGQADIAGFAQSDPLGLVATFALHLFALLDQDYPFPYIREVDPWHRWPLSVVNYLFLWGAAVGLVVGWRRWWRPGTRLAWAVLLVVGSGYAAVYLPTRVECRYGLPLFPLLTPAVAVAALAMREWARARAWGAVMVAGGSALATGVACAGLSVWLQAQAPALVMVREFYRPPGPEVPIARFEIPPPDRWVVEQQRTYTVRATNVGARTWYAERPAEVYLRVMFVKPGDVEVVDSRVELVVPIAQEVPPGGQLELDVTVTAPRKEGEYWLRHQLEFNKDQGLSAWLPHDTRAVVDVRRSNRR